MLAPHNIKDLLNSDINKKLSDIAMNIVNDLALFEGDVDSQDIIVATEIARAIDALLKKQNFTSRAGTHYSVNQIQEFFNLHQATLQKLAGQLAWLNEIDLFNDINTLGQLLHADQWKVDTSITLEKSLLASENSKVILYRAKNGELAIRFPSTETRNKFLEQFTQGQVPEPFRIGPQYAKNPEGKTPVCYPDHTNRIYVPSYNARYGEVGINLGNQNNRDLFIKLLGLSITATKQNGKCTQTSYGNGLFDIYSYPTQLNAIYFNSTNKIFNQPGAFLKINTATGEITQGQIKNFDTVISKAPSRFDERKAVDEVLTEKCKFEVKHNVENESEIEIKFPNQASRDQWHFTFVGFAQLIGLAINEHSLVMKSDNDSCVLRIKASYGLGSAGVFLTNSQPSTHFQAPGGLGIDFGDEQLREFFITSFNISDKQAEIYRGNNDAKAKTLNFNPSVLGVQGLRTWETEYNDKALSNYAVLLVENNPGNKLQYS